MKTGPEKAAYMRQWYARNKERITAENRAKTTDEQRAEWREENQRRKEYMRQWHAAHRDEVKARIAAKKADPAYRDKVNASGRAYRKTAASILWRSRIRAKKKKIEHDLAEAWLQARLDTGKCELSGLPFTEKGKLGPLMPSIDRRDSSKGYTQDNCRVIAWALNAAFNDWGEQAAREVWAAYLTRNPG